MKPLGQIKIGAKHWPVCERCGRILFPATSETGLCSSCLQDDDPEVIEDIFAIRQHYKTELMAAKMLYLQKKHQEADDE